MVVSDFVRESVKVLYKPMIIITVLYTLLIWLPKKNILSINLAIISVVLVAKLTGSIYNRSDPKVWDWAKTIFKTVVFVSIMYYSLVWLGGYGLVGFLIIILLFVAYRLVKGWKLYKYTCGWGADMLMGNKRRFDTDEFKKDVEDREGSGSSEAHQRQSCSDIQVQKGFQWLMQEVPEEGSEGISTGEHVKLRGLL